MKKDLKKTDFKKTESKNKNNNYEPRIIFDESVLPYLEDHKDVNMIQFFVNQFFAGENHEDLILQTKNFDLQIFFFEDIIYITCINKH